MLKVMRESFHQLKWILLAVVAAFVIGFVFIDMGLGGARVTLLHGSIAEALEKKYANASLQQLAEKRSLRLPATLDRDRNAQRRRLTRFSGGQFDRAYVDHEVAYHQAVLDAIDKTLLPNAKNAELKALLEKSRPAFVAHLEHARHIQSSLGKSGA